MAASFTLFAHQNTGKDTSKVKGLMYHASQYNCKVLKLRYDSQYNIDGNFLCYMMVQLVPKYLVAGHLVLKKSYENNDF